MSDRYMNDQACGIEPEHEGEAPTLAQWRDRCRQLYRENKALREKSHLHCLHLGRTHSSGGWHCPACGKRGPANISTGM